MRYTILTLGTAELMVPSNLELKRNQTLRRLVDKLRLNESFYITSIGVPTEPGFSCDSHREILSYMQYNNAYILNFTGIDALNIPVVYIAFQQKFLETIFESVVNVLSDTSSFSSGFLPSSLLGIIAIPNKAICHYSANDIHTNEALGSSRFVFTYTDVNLLIRGLARGLKHFTHDMLMSFDGQRIDLDIIIPALI